MACICVSAGVTHGGTLYANVPPQQTDRVTSLQPTRLITDQSLRIGSWLHSHYLVIWTSLQSHAPRDWVKCLLTPHRAWQCGRTVPPESRNHIDGVRNRERLLA